MVFLVFLCSLGLCVVCSALPLFIFFSLQTIAFMAYLSKFVDAFTASLYLVPSLVGSLLWLVGAVGPWHSAVTMCLGILLKLGFFPFWGWALLVCSRLCSSSLFIFMVPLKFGSLYVLLYCVGVPPFLAFLCYLTGLYFLFLSNSLGLLLLGSSLVSVCYFCFMLPCPWLFYFSVYGLVLAAACGLPFCSLSLSLSVLSLCGAAPLALFWGKFLVVSCLSPLLGCLFLILTALPMPAYYSFLFGALDTRSSFPSFLLASVFGPPASLFCFLA